MYKFLMFAALLFMSLGAISIAHASDSQLGKAATITDKANHQLAFRGWDGMGGWGNGYSGGYRGLYPYDYGYGGYNYYQPSYYNYPSGYYNYYPYSSYGYNGYYNYYPYSSYYYDTSPGYGLWYSW